MNLSSPRGSGYPSDVDYPSFYSPGWAPINMEYLCLLQGINPPGGGDEFTYLDLGCGNAYGLALLAAANPKAEFYGVDFNPSHIFQGQE
ncbi:MAG: methyltransferase domain-containing protein, partial [Candidatus Competibacterales bacterium]